MKCFFLQIILIVGVFAFVIGDGGFVYCQKAHWFKTGQDADIVLSAIDFNNTGGPLLFNHPGTIASDGIHLLLADRNNNRILIWNKLPTGNIPPDIVLGQKDFITNQPGTGLYEFNWPVSVAADGTHIIVTDTYNDRILIWNSFPTQNAQPADLELKGGRGIPQRGRGNIVWPWAVWSNGEKLIITSTGASQVLIWNTFPTQNNQKPDIVLTLDAFGTPRTIGSNGKNLVIGDHNAYKKDRGNFFWKEFPTKDNEPFDFFMRDVPRGPGLQGPQMGEVFWGNIFTPDGRFLSLTNTINIWNSFPENENDVPSLCVDYRSFAGDGSGATFADGKLYLSLSNGNKIVGYQSFPSTPNQKPDFVIGSPDIQTNTLEVSNIMSNPVPATDGKSLFVSSDFDRKLYVWKNLPDESGAKPDFIYNIGGWDNDIYKGVFAQAGQREVYIWKTPPIYGQPPDITFRGSIGSIKLQEVRGVALDAKYFYLSDASQNKIYIWEGLPAGDRPPKYILTTDKPHRLCSDGKYLVVTATLSNETGHIKIFPIDKLQDNAQPIVVRFKNLRTNLPQSVIASHGHLFVADTCFNRVLVWRDIEDAITGNNPDVILGAETLDEVAPEIGRNKLFWPGAVAFDGSFLWVGEFKFSERLLRFSVQP